MDLISHGSLLCLDSLNSRIYLNSRRSKYCKTMETRFSNPNRSISKNENGDYRKQYDRLSYEALFDNIQELNNRLSKLEEI